MKRDIKSNVDFAVTLLPATRAATSTGVAVDLRDYSGAMAVFSVGTMVAGGTLTGQLQESMDGTTYGTVSQGDLQGTFTAMTGTNSQRVGYIGTARYVQGVAVWSGTGAGAPCEMLVLRGYPNRAPLA